MFLLLNDNYLMYVADRKYRQCSAILLICWPKELEPKYAPNDCTETSPQIINQKSHQEQAVLEVLTEDVCEHHLESIHLGTLDPNVAGIIGPENPILMAALDGTSPIVAVQSGKCDEFGKALLRHLIPKGENGEREQDFATTLEEKLRFSSDPTMKVMEDEIIPDDLSDRLFGDYGIDEDDETMVEDEYQLG